jgi:hypothetical protein
MGGRSRNLSINELAALLNRPRGVATPHPVIIGATQPSQPVIVGTGAGDSQKRVREQAKIVIKQQVNQNINSRKQRKKRSVGSIVAKKKEYTALKKEIKKRLTTQKKEALKTALLGVNKLPVKERAAARKRIRKELSDKLKSLTKQIPPLSKKKYQEVVALIKKIQSIKW